MRTTLFYTIFLLLSFQNLFAQDYPEILTQGDSVIAYEGDMIKEFSLKFDNDLLSGWIDGEKSDDDYTTGVKLDWRLRYLHSPLFVGFGKHDFERENENFIRNNTKFSIGSYFYTPKDLSLVEVDSTDRPYAGFQYLGFGRVSDRKRLNQDMISNHYSKFESELQIGLIGGPLSENLQNWVHRFAVPVSENPQGWANQIGGKSGTFAINYHLEYEVLWLSTKVKQKFKRHTPDGFHVYNIYQPANISLFLYSNLGNFRSDFAAGLRINLFNLNQTNKYFLNFYDHDRADNYPSGPGPYLKVGKKTEHALFPEDADTFSPDMRERNLTECRFQFKNLMDYSHAGCTCEWLLDMPKKEVQQMLLDSAKARASKVEIPDEFSYRIHGNSLNSKTIDGQKISSEDLKVIEQYVYLEGAKRDFRPLVDMAPRYYNRRWEFSFFVEPQFRWVGYNGMLQGVLFDKDEYYTVRIINPFVYEARSGFELKYDFVKLEVTFSVRSQEFLAYPKEEFPGIGQTADGKKWHKWGAINFYYYPNLLRKSIDRYNTRKRLKRLSKLLPELKKS